MGTGHSFDVWEVLSLLLDHHGDGTEAYLREELAQAEDDAVRAGWDELLRGLAEMRVKTGPRREADGQGAGQ
jgi:hypothetical protein